MHRSRIIAVTLAAIALACVPSSTSTETNVICLPSGVTFTQIDSTHVSRYYVVRHEQPVRPAVFTVHRRGDGSESDRIVEFGAPNHHVLCAR